jgi:hypothetical protein
MNVLIDVNVVLDVILERQPWLGDSKGVWDACHQMRIAGHLVATGLTNLFLSEEIPLGILSDAAKLQAPPPAIPVNQILPFEN